jgi:ATP-dependent exoDNAse (exonuclease V), alpha subunit - helicase superfamily I member
VVGAAPSGVAAEKLQDETGIPSTTLHRLLERAARDELPPRCLVIIDEAGMAETRVLAPVLERIEAIGGKAVLIGDPQQLPAVGAGGLFAGIVERHGAIVLKENRRQHDELERRALEAVRAGIGREYLAFAEQRDRLVVSEDPLATKTPTGGLVDARTQRPDGKRHARAAPTRRRRTKRPRAGLMDSHGRLGRERLTIGGREFAPETGLCA